MMLLQDILYKAGLEELIGSTNLAVEKICSDSRLADPLSAFIAVRGTQTDGHKFIDSALDQGCNIIICETLPVETSITSAIS